MNFPPKTQEDFDALYQEYSGNENTACIFSCVKDGGAPNQGIIGDAMAVLVLITLMIRHIAEGTESTFTDIIGALNEINSMEE